MHSHLSLTAIFSLDSCTFELRMLTECEFSVAETTGVIFGRAETIPEESKQRTSLAKQRHVRILSTLVLNEVHSWVLMAP